MLSDLQRVSQSCLPGSALHICFLQIYTFIFVWPNSNLILFLNALSIAVFNGLMLTIVKANNPSPHVINDRRFHFIYYTFIYHTMYTHTHTHLIITQFIFRGYQITNLRCVEPIFCVTLSSITT